MLLANRVGSLVFVLALIVTLFTWAPAVSDGECVGSWSMPQAVAGDTARTTDLERERVVEPAHEREIILRTVRRYRPTAEDTWRHVLTDSVYRESLSAGMDPLLVAAMVARESSFQSQVVSSAGAVGLMQVRPWVAQDVAERRGRDADLEWQGLETLHAPDSNVRLGILYYQELMRRFDGDQITALEAYNRGPTRVSQELREGTLSATRYAESVLRLYRRLDAKRSLTAASRGWPTRNG